MSSSVRTNLGRGLAIGVCLGILVAALFYWLLDESLPAAITGFVTPVIVFAVLGSKI